MVMFGLFKKAATPDEFGHALFELTWEFVSSDAARALAARFDDFWDTSFASGGYSNYIERKGVSMETQKLHYRLFTHCAIQAACTQFDAGMRHAITRGAIAGGFTSKLDGYDFGKTYTTLEAAYLGQYKFVPEVEPLFNSDATISWLPNPNVGVLNAKYLIESFIIPNMKNSKAFLDDFAGYSSAVCAPLGSVGRGINHLLRSFKISGVR
jgi:hypothetical protein